MPDHLEAGTLNSPGLAGLEVGIAFVLEQGVETLHARASDLKRRLRSGLMAIPGVRVLSPAAPDGVGIVTLTVDNLDPSSLALRLDRDWGVQGRWGLHCAPECHRMLGTLGSGALRLSLGWATTETDVDRALEGIEALVGRHSASVGSA
jgi:selenocysteine lyase/cysteine desulfurase